MLRIPVSLRARPVILAFLALSFLLDLLSATPSRADDFETSVAKLNDQSFTVKEEAVLELVQSGDDRALAILSALQDGELFSHKKQNNVIVFSQEIDGAPHAIDVLTAADLGEHGKRDLKKITINNKLRGALKAALGALRLYSKDPDTRIAAAKAVLANPSPEALPLVVEAIEKEQDDAVREALDMAQAALLLTNGDAEERLAAVGMLSGSMDPDVWQVLGRAAGQEADADLAAAAQAALASIENQKSVYNLLETLFFGVSLGAVLLLAAVGLAITFGVMGVINMAHGEMLMLGAYTTFVVQQLMPNAIEYSLFVAVPAAFIVTGLVGIAIERSIIRLLYGRPLETLLATFGISLFLQQAVRSIFSPLNQPVTTPDWMSGFYAVNGALSLTYNRLYIIVFCILVFLALLAVLKRTPLGLQMRAVTQNRAMASSMGIRTGRVDALTFGLGSGIAGIGGVALSQLTNVGPNLGQAYIVDSFMVVVFGGVGNLWGTLVGALTLGVANKFMEPWTGAVVAKILVLVFIILFIQRRPRGLFALKGRAVES
ncbi:urea ABC transporter permease subunit UrtB [Rhodospirillaceae bacterium KN72]|uniref:Urea ABC transporter permease subunit UrtB n=1 Tax=Pacificispira spongiicola TaxID=2729598 RepID=A0A7Y0E2R6_9PROT|nr:urea ABC transporter permease subunit UrtB [Pacificispira spongiicola]NMM46165.1 urea ABC transporter permease subunit UrtB [Pacificispira spongiicola]